MCGLQQDIHNKNIDANVTVYGLVKLLGIWSVLRMTVRVLYIVECGLGSMLPVGAVQQHILTDLTHLWQVHVPRPGFVYCDVSRMVFP